VDNDAQDTPGARAARAGAPTVSLPRLRGTCAACGTVRAGLKLCAACGRVEYCGREVCAPIAMRCLPALAHAAAARAAARC
jgi:hypothetical protein